MNRDAAAVMELLGKDEAVDFKEYDESVANEVEMLTCPHCGKTYPK
jgi:uncharacterized protein YbaR (Trm112 family)